MGDGVPVGVTLGVLDGEAPGLRVGLAVPLGERGAGVRLGVGLVDGLRSMNCTGTTAVAGMPGPAAPTTVIRR